MKHGSTEAPALSGVALLGSSVLLGSLLHPSRVMAPRAPYSWPPWPPQVFYMKPLQVVFPAQADPDSPVVDLDLHLPFLCFSPEKVLQVSTAGTGVGSSEL